MLAAPREHQQGLGVEPHGLVQQQFAQFLGQRRAAGLAGLHHVQSGFAQPGHEPFQVRALARAVHALERDEAAAAGGGGVRAGTHGRTVSVWKDGGGCSPCPLSW